MKIKLNNIEEEINTPKNVLTISELRTIKKFTFRNLVVKINGQLVKRGDYDSVTFREGDNVEVIHLIAGG
jgi:thiamine biosynthesis protein ThiS